MDQSALTLDAAGSSIATTKGDALPAIQEGPGALLSAILSLAKDPDFDATKLEKLMQMQERMEDRQAARVFAEALHDAQAEIPPVEKLGFVNLDAKDPKKGYAFARWEDMDKVLRPIMERHGFTLAFDMATKEGGGAVVTGTLLHIAGHSKAASIPLALDSGAGRNNLQAMGSTLSYGKRYVAEMLFNIVRKGVDDDGHEGGMERVGPEEVARLTKALAMLQMDAGAFLDRHGYKGRNLEDVAKQDFAKLLGTLEETWKERKRKTEGGQ